MLIRTSYHLRGPNLRAPRSVLVVEGELGELAPLASWRPDVQARVDALSRILARSLSPLRIPRSRDLLRSLARSPVPAVGMALLLAAEMTRPHEPIPALVRVDRLDRDGFALTVGCEDPRLFEAALRLASQAIARALGELAGDEGRVPSRNEPHAPSNNEPHAPSSDLLAAWEAARARALPPALAGLVRAAVDRGLPWQHADDNHEAVLLGHGHRALLVDAGTLAGPREAPRAPARTAADARLARLVPDGADLRVPTVGVTGSIGKTTTCRMIEAVLARAGLRVAGTGSQGVRIDGRLVGVGDYAGGQSAQRALRDPRVTAGVFELARGGLLTRGMTLDSVDVGVVLNVGDNHVGLDGIRSPDHLAAIKSIVAARARRAVVLNADDPRCLVMRSRVSAPVVCLAAPGGRSALIDDALEGEGVASWVERIDGRTDLVLQRGAQRVATIDVRAIPCTLGGIASAKVENALFAAAAAWMLGIAPSVIAAALSGFDAGYETNPGRMNLFEGGGITVLMDALDGERAWRVLAETVRAMPVRGRRIGLMSAYGNRQDEQIVAVGRAGAGAFDHYVCTNIAARGRTPTAVPDLIARGLLAAGVDPARIARIPDHAEAVRHALDRALPGDLVLIEVDFASHGDVRQTIEARLRDQPASALGTRQES